MPISQQIGSSSLAKPGVCTSTTRPASPYQGQVIYETDTARTLVWNGSGWVFLSTSTANPVGLEFIAKVTATSGTTIQVDNVFSAAFDAYKIIVTDAYCGTASGLTMQLRNSSGPSAMAYMYGGVYLTSYTSGVFNASVSNAASSWDLNTVIAAGHSGFSMDIFNVFQAERTSFSAVGCDSRSIGAPRCGVSGIHDSTTSYTGFQFVLANAVTTFKVCVYGYRE